MSIQEKSESSYQDSFIEISERKKKCLTAKERERKKEKNSAKKVSAPTFC